MLCKNYFNFLFPVRVIYEDKKHGVHTFSYRIVENTKKTWPFSHDLNAVSLLPYFCNHHDADTPYCWLHTRQTSRQLTVDHVVNVITCFLSYKFWKKVEMPSFCSVVGCGKRDVSFYIISVVRKTLNKGLRALSLERRERWIKALKREIPRETFLKNARICSSHYITGM